MSAAPDSAGLSAMVYASRLKSNDHVYLGIMSPTPPAAAAKFIAEEISAGRVVEYVPREFANQRFTRARIGLLLNDADQLVTVRCAHGEHIYCATEGCACSCHENALPLSMEVPHG